MIYIRRVRMINWMPFRGEFVLEFTARQIVGVLGTYEDDEAKSNRAGKSGFFDAVKWCIWGKSRARREVELIHEGAEETRVEVTLADDATGVEAVVARWRDTKAKGGLDFVGWEGKRKAATQAQIDQLVGLNYDEAMQTAWFAQGDINQFMDAGPNERKAMLMRWLQTTPWGEHAEVLDTYRVATQREVDRLRAALDAVAGDSEAMDKDAMVARAHALDERKAVLAGKLKTVSDKRIAAATRAGLLRKCAATVRRAGELTDKAAELRRQRGQANAYAPQVRELEKKLAAAPFVSDERRDEVKDKRQRASQAQTERAVELRGLEAEVESARRTMTGVCPLLKQSCDRIKLTDGYLDKRKERIEELRDSIETAKRAIEKCDSVEAVAVSQRKLRHELELLNQKALAAAALEDRIADTERQSRAMLKDVPEDYEEQLEAAEAEVLRLEERAAKLSAAAGMVAQDRASLVAAWNAGLEREERRVATQAALERAERALADAQYVGYMFGPNGIPSRELENSFGTIEAEANFVLKRLRTPFQVELSAVRELQDWEGNCLACGWLYPRGAREHRCESCGTAREKKRKDELQLRILEGKRERQFYMDSGGGKLLLAVAIRIALARLAQRKTGTQWGALFLDEVFSSLDAVNRQAMVALITRTLVHDLGFGQVFLISHEPEVRDAVPTTLLVRRQPNGRSVIGWT